MKKVLSRFREGIKVFNQYLFSIIKIITQRNVMVIVSPMILAVFGLFFTLFKDEFIDADSFYIVMTYFFFEITLPILLLSIFYSPKSVVGIGIILIVNAISNATIDTLLLYGSLDFETLGILGYLLEHSELILLLIATGFAVYLAVKAVTITGWIGYGTFALVLLLLAFNLDQTISNNLSNKIWYGYFIIRYILVLFQGLFLAAIVVDEEEKYRRRLITDKVKY
jgi:hypothetical protein